MVDRANAHGPRFAPGTGRAYCTPSMTTAFTARPATHDLLAGVAGAFLDSD
jgi:hypothetical protein